MKGMKIRKLMLLCSMFLSTALLVQARGTGSVRIDGTFGNSVEAVGGCAFTENDGSFDIVSKQWKAGVMLRVH